MVIGVIPRPKILTGQPQSAVSIDWSNPNARGLIGAWTASTPGLLGGVANPVGSVITTQPTPGGRVWRGAPATASDNYVRVERGPFTYTTQVTFEALLRVNSFNATTSPYIGGIISQWQYDAGAAADAPGPLLRFGNGVLADRGRVQFAVQTGVANFRNVVAPINSTVAGNTYHIVGMFYPGGTLLLYIDGRLVASGSAFSTTFNNNANNFISLLSDLANNSTTQNRSLDADLFLARIYNVAKTEQEVISLYKDPWGMFKQTQFLHTDSTPSPTSRTFFVPRKKVMSRQPAGPAAAIDWGNPITQGLASAYIPTAAQYRSFDLATNTRDLTTNADFLPPYRPGAAGFALDSTDTNYVWSISFEPVALRGYPKTGYAALTVFSLFESRTTNQFGVIYGGGQDGTYYGRLVVSSDATIAFIAASNNASLHPKAPLVADTLYAATGIQSFTRSYRALYVNGHLAETRTESINNLNNGFFAGSIYNTQLRRIKLYCGYVWVRELSAAEIKSLSDNPWQIFKQDRLSPALAEDGKVYAPFMS